MSGAALPVRVVPAQLPVVQSRGALGALAAYLHAGRAVVALLSASVHDGETAAQLILRSYAWYAPERGGVWGATHRDLWPALLARALSAYLLDLTAPTAFDLDAFEPHLVAAVATPPAPEGTDDDLAALIRLSTRSIA